MYKYIRLMRNRDGHSIIIGATNFCGMHSRKAGEMSYSYPKRHILLKINGDIHV